MIGKLVSPKNLLPQVRLNRNFCSAVSSFRTPETNPAKLNESHLGRYFTMDFNLYKLLYGASDKGVGLPSKFKIQCTTFREASFLVRKPFIDLKNCIESYDPSLPVMRYILYGAPGVGKTITISNMVHYGYVQGYVLVHVPWVPTWTRFTKETVPSSTRPGYYDHTVDSVFWLTLFRHQNSKLLSQLQLKTTKQYEWSQRENTPVGSDLVSIAEHGIARPVHAADCIYAILSELKTLSSDRKCKTMVLIDGVNGLFYDPIEIKYPNKENVPYQFVTIFEAFKQLFKSDWTNGVVIGVVDKLAIQAEYRESDLPRYLLNKDGWEHFDPFVPIIVEKYTSEELQTTLDYYLDRKWLQHPLAATPEARLELEVVSFKNPYDLMMLCKGR